MRHLLSAIRGFLGTYTRRYADLNGYWLWGLFIAERNSATIDLLYELNIKQSSTTEAYAIQLAKTRFDEQLSKVGISKDKIKSATLKISTLPEATFAPVNEVMSKMITLRFEVIATCQQGRCVTDHAEIHVAPHNPKTERQSLRATRGT